MILDLKGKKVVLIGGRNSVGRAIAEAVAREGADVVIWLRKCINGVDEAKALPVTQLEVPSQLPMEQRQPRSGAKRWCRNLTGDPVRERQNLTTRAQRFLK
jgi:NAD(P)-dependent dehydrogenase (short-subunit alcohol dehydrogenase family)